MPLKVVRDSYRDGREAYEAKLILVRPDLHVVWRGHDKVPSPDELAAVATGNCETAAG